jgi:hypothetical protein
LEKSAMRRLPGTAGFHRHFRPYVFNPTQLF